MNTRPWDSQDGKDGKDRQREQPQVRELTSSLEWEPPEIIQWPAGLKQEEIEKLVATHAKFKARWKEHRDLQERLRLGRLLDDLAAETESESTASNKLPTLPAHSMLRATKRLWRRRKRSIRTYVLDQIECKVGELAEKNRARRTWLFAVRGDRLKAIVTNGYTGDAGHTIPVAGQGVVPLVARTRIPYVVHDVEKGDPYYKVFTPETRSEQAVAIVFRGRLLGVINQESNEPGNFDAAAARVLEDDAAQLIPLLLALEAHKGRYPDLPRACLWNPGRHGWDFRGFLDRLIQRLKASLGRYSHGLHISLWYADPDDKTLFTLASTGYGCEFLTKNLVPGPKAKPNADSSIENSFTWKMALSPEGHVADCVAGDEGLLRPEVDGLMGLLKVRSVTVRTCIPSPEVGEGQAGMVIALYVTDPAVEAVLPDKADLREIARLLREQIEAFRILRPVLAAAAVACAMKAARDIPDQIETLAELTRQILHAEAATILGRSSESNVLRTIASTGELESDEAYDVNDRSRTAWLARNSGRALRINLRGMSRLPSGCPTTPLNQVRERVPRSVSARRRLVGCGVPAQGDELAVAVIRAVRAADTRPFTLCDRETLEALCQACRDVCENWRQYDPKNLANPPSGLIGINLPLHATAGRSIQCRVREHLMDVYDLVNTHYGDGNADCVRQVAVLIGAPDNPARPVHPFAYYSKDFPTPPPLGSNCAFDAPRMGPGTTWTDLFGDPRPRSFSDDTDSAEEGKIHATARIPFGSWCGRHAVPGILAVDFTEPKELEATLIQKLCGAARKIATVLTMDDGVENPFHLETGPQTLISILRERLRAIGVQVYLSGQTLCDGTVPLAELDDEEEWMPPLAVSPRDGSIYRDADAELLTVREAYTSDAYLIQVPLTVDMQRVGELVAAWDLQDVLADPDDGASIRNRAVGRILASWMAWSWNRYEARVVPDRFVPAGATITWVPSTPRLRRSLNAGTATVGV